MVPQMRLNLSPEESLIKAIKEHDIKTLEASFSNIASFSSTFTENNYNLTMLILDNGTKETFDFYLKYCKDHKRKIKFAQRNIVI